VADVLKPQFDLFPELGTRICFTSVNAGDLPREIVWNRLREVGDAAAARNIVVAMETHPNLVENAKNSRITMDEVNHPNIRVNFDTANIYYYNEGINAVDELKESAEFVASVHLKDSSGKYRTWDFPVLGQGVVDFPAVFQTMSDRGFPGPFTMELEGTEGVKLDRDACLKHIADSAMHLKSIGVLDS
jgi:inosose dehydratase